MTFKSREFHEISTFLENVREGPVQLRGCLQSTIECLRVSWKGMLDMIRRAFLVYTVLNICNIEAGEIGSEKRSPFL